MVLPKRPALRRTGWAARSSGRRCCASSIGSTAATGPEAILRQPSLAVGGRMPAEAPEQGHRCSGVAHLVAADYIDVDVTGLAVLASRIDAVKPSHRGAGGPGFRSRGPEIKRGIGITQFCSLLRSHDAGVDEGRSSIVDLRVSGFACDRDGDAVLPHQRDEIARAKAGASNLDYVAYRPSFYFLRQ